MDTGDGSSSSYPPMFHMPYKRKPSTGGSRRKSSRRKRSSIQAGSYVALTLLGRPPGQNQKPLEPPPQPHYSKPSSPTERVTAPQPVDSVMDKELKCQKMKTINAMHQQAVEIYEKVRRDYVKNQSDRLQIQLADALKTVKTLEQQLANLTGVQPGSNTPSPLSPCAMSPVSPGSMGKPQYRSTDSLSSGSSPVQPQEGPTYETLTYPPPTEKNPTPWLPGGPKHKKTGSMPDSFFQSPEVMGARDVNVKRTHSDADSAANKQRRLCGGSEGIQVRHKGMTSSDSYPLLPNSEKHRNSSDKDRTSSLPSSMHDSGNLSDSPSQSPATSPTPTHTRQVWADDGQSDTNDDNIQDGESRGPVSSSPESHPPAGLTVVSPQQVNIMSMDDEEFSTDDEHLDEHGPFSDINILKTRSAHLAVFLHYLISNSDPSPLFFYLVTDHYPNGTLKEMRKWAYEIFSTFLAEKSPLRVNVDENIINKIDSTLVQKSENEGAMRIIFQMARANAETEIAELMADFRNKQALGLGSLYGDHELQDENMDRNVENRIIDKYLVPHFERFYNVDDDRTVALAASLATFFKLYMVGRSMGGNVERCQSFVAKDKKRFQFTKNKKSYTMNGHHLNAHHYHSTTNCTHCHSLLWGTGYQGYQCSDCYINLHKQCIEKVADCSGAGKKKKPTRTSMFGNIMRKQSANNPSAIPPAYHTAVKEATALHAERELTSPTSGSSTFHVRSALAEDDEEMMEPVGSLVHKYDGQDELSPSDPASPRSKSPDTTELEDSQRKTTINLNRSESLNKKKETKSQHVRRTRSDVAVDEITLKALNQSGSSSNSSLSTRSLDSPSNSTDAVNDISSKHHDDSDFETEAELPSLETFIPKDILKKLKPKEKKRQEVINELFYTEKAHVRNLKVLDRVFYQPMRNEHYIPHELVKLLFPNLSDVIQVHSALNNEMKARKRESPQVGDVADILLGRFDADAGKQFKNAVAVFCKNQAYALETLKNKTRKDQKLAAFLADQECNSLCRRFQLKDLIVTGMQRLTKYPLLIENLMKYTQTNTEEYEHLKQSLVLSKAILECVNSAVKECENLQRLAEMQKRIDRRPLENVSNNQIVSEYKNIDLTRHKLVYDGQLTWRISRQKQIDLHVVLLEDILVLLQKQDDKLVLKCQSTNMVVGKDDTKNTHSPIIKLVNLLTRNVAIDKRAFFLVNTSDNGPQIYELVAMSSDERRKWFKYISDATEAYRVKSRNSKVEVVEPVQAAPLQVPEPVQATPSIQAQETATTAIQDLEKDSVTTTTLTTHQADSGDTKKDDDKELDQAETATATASVVEPYDRNKSSSVDSLGTFETVEVFESDQAALIHPAEVAVSNTVFERAEPVLTPIEHLKRKDELIQKTLEEKQHLVAEILNIPIGDFETIADMAGEVEGDKEARELVLASIQQANKLTSMANEGLKASEKETASQDTSATEAAPQEGAAVGASKAEEDVADSSSSSSSSKVVDILLPADRLLAICNALNEQLTQLLGIVTDRDEERERLRQELKVANEQVAILREAGPPRSPSGSISRSRPNSFISVTSSVSENFEVAEEIQQPVSSSDESAFFSSPSRSATAVVVSVEGATEGLLQKAEESVVVDEREESVDEVQVDMPEESSSSLMNIHQEEDNVTVVDDIVSENKTTSQGGESIVTSPQTDLDNESCGTTDTDSTGNTVIGAIF